jgi:UDP-N-acetyl-D-galactosamine dehydrogenase
MGEYVASQVVKLMIKKGITVHGAHLLLLGITFKENCPDVRNTKIVDVVKALEEYGIEVTIFDPWANPEEVMREYGLVCHAKFSSIQIQRKISNSFEKKSPSHLDKGQVYEEYEAIVLGVAHKEFLNLDLSSLKKENCMVYDVKGILGNSDGKL